MATMRPSRCPNAIVSMAQSSSRMTKPARPFTVAVRHCMAGSEGVLRAMPARKRKILSAQQIGLSAAARLPPPLRIEHRVFRQKLHQHSGIARLRRGAKRRGQTGALLPRSREARPAYLDMRAGARGKLATSRFAAIQGTLHFGVVEAEHVV